MKVKEMEGQNSTAGRSKRSREGQRQRGAMAAHCTHSQQQLCPQSPQSHSDVGSSPSHIWEFVFPGRLAEPGQGGQEGRALTFSSRSPQLDVPKQAELSVAMPAFYSCSQLVKQADLGSLGGLYSNKPIRKWAKLQNKFLEGASTYFTGSSRLGCVFSTDNVFQQSSVGSQILWIKGCSSLV